MIILFLLSLASTWNLPTVGAITESTAVCLIGLTEQDSTRTIFSLNTSYGATSDTVYGRFNKMNLTGLTPDTFYHYKVITFRSAAVETTVDRTFRTQDTTGSFKFVIIGDIVAQGWWAARLPETDSLLKQIRKDGADFMVILGDIVWLTDMTPENTSKADTAYHVLHTHVDTTIDSMMICAAIGNHDIIAPASQIYTQAQVDTSIKSYNNALVSYPALDSAYYWWRWGKCAFVIINDMWLNWSKLGATQLNYMQDVFCDSLLAENYNWKIAFNHRPIYFWGSGNTDKISLQGWFLTANVNFSFAGNLHHYYNYGKVGNTRYIVSGGGGGEIAPGGDFDIFHYILMDVSPDSIMGYVKGTTGDTVTTFTYRVYQYNKLIRKAKLGKVKL